MPIYEFICETCGHKEEILEQGFSPPDMLAGCPKCKGTMNRIISLSNVIYKASGFTKRIKKR